MSAPEIPFGAGEAVDEEELRRPNPFPYSESEDITLAEDYTPTKHDVINGRGRKSYNHIANRRFRQLISMNLERYLAARCKVDKTLVVVGIVNTIRNSTPTGGFLKKCPKKGRWVSMSDESAREKVGHCLRDMIASQRDSKDKAAAKSLAMKNAAAAINATKPKVEQSNSGATTSTGHLAMGAAAAMTDTKTGIPPHLNPWMPAGTAGMTERLPPHPNSSGTNTLDAPYASMWATVKSEITGNTTTVTDSSSSTITSNNPQQQRFGGKPSPLPPLTAPSSSSRAAPDPPPTVLPLSLSNLDAVSLQKGNLQDMSEQQRKILTKLESGFKGSVEELMNAVK